MFRRMWNSWKRVARRIADFQIRMLLALFYYTLLAPFALLVRVREAHSAGWTAPAEPSISEQQRAQEQS